MNCIVVININGFLTENARSSIRAACSRWCADYLEVSHHPIRHLHPCFLKVKAFRRLCGYDRIGYFDADMLIRNDAPNCFELYPDDGKLYMVRDIGEARPWTPETLKRNIVDWVRVPYFEPVASLLGGEVGFQRYLDHFANAGFLICSPIHHAALFQFIESHFPSSDHRLAGNGHYEQAILNYAVQLFCPEDLELVDETWNFIEPDLRVERMNSYVYHFAGLNDRALKAAISDFPWTS